MGFWQIDSSRAEGDWDEASEAGGGGFKTRQSAVLAQAPTHLGSWGPGPLDRLPPQQTDSGLPSSVYPIL